MTASLMVVLRGRHPYAHAGRLSMRHVVASARAGAATGAQRFAHAGADVARARERTIAGGGNSHGDRSEGRRREALEAGQAWDAVLLVKYPSRGAFVAMVTDPEYQRITHLRTAALREAVLQPTIPWRDQAS
jgi:hypothetical protein